jgi:hypothetical protein
MVIPEDEYRLEIEGEDFEFEEQADPGAYSTEIMVNEDEYELEMKKAEHKQQLDYQKYLCVRTCRNEETTHRICECDGARNLSTSHMQRSKTNHKAENGHEEIYFEWAQSKDITEYFAQLEQVQIKLDRWEVEVKELELVETAVNQIQDSGFFDHKFLRDWKRKPDH